MVEGRTSGARTEPSAGARLPPISGGSPRVCGRAGVFPPVLRTLGKSGLPTTRE